MKATLLTLTCALVLTACSGTSVKQTYVATGAANPSGIYIRPFNVSEGAVRMDHGGEGAKPIKESLYGRQFAETLQLEMSKMAPSMVIEADEDAPRGWVIEGDLDLLDAGLRPARGVFGPLGIGKSTVMAHVRIVDVDKGEVVYAFDISGGSGFSGRWGTLKSAGMGHAIPFDFRNLAEEIYLVLSRNPGNYGTRSSIDFP